jgi:hypothetical protein
MKTEVTNLLTLEKSFFVNDNSLTENIVSCIICNQKRTGKILDKQYREEVKAKFPIIETVSKITGRKFAYCEKLDLHAKEYN